MNNNKNQLVMEAAQKVRDHMNSTEFEWDEAFYRYVQYNEGHYSSQLTYRKDRKLKFPVIRGDWELSKRGSHLSRTLEGIIQNLNLCIKEENNEIPKVVVVSVTLAGEYRVVFEYKNTNALDISIIALGSKNSFFQNNEIDIP